MISSHLIAPYPQGLYPDYRIAYHLEGGLGRMEQLHFEMPTQYYPVIPMEEFYYYDSNRDTEIPEALEGCDASVNSQGIISLRLSNGVKIHLTVDGSVRIQNTKFSTILALSKNGQASAMFHPNGLVYHNGDRIEVRAKHHLSDKFANIRSRGITFTTEECNIVYLVDEAGVRTSSGYFNELNFDITLDVFYKDATFGQHAIPQALAHLREAEHWKMSDSTDCWVINNTRIVQKQDGFTRIHRNGFKHRLRTSPMNGSSAITSPLIHCTASLGNSQHLFVRKDQRRMHYNGNDFIVRYAGHSAGFRGKNLFKIY